MYKIVICPCICCCPFRATCCIFAVHCCLIFRALLCILLVHLCIVFVRHSNMFLVQHCSTHTPKTVHQLGTFHRAQSCSTPCTPCTIYLIRAPCFHVCRACIVLPIVYSSPHMLTLVFLLLLFKVRFSKS